MEDEQRKEFIRQVFNTVCAEYGRGNLRFFENAAACLPGLLDLKGDETILDVAAGTGLASTKLAEHVPQGRVTGLDLSEGMLGQARSRADQLGLDNIEFLEMDMTRMELPENHYDVINSSFGVFFVEDMDVLVKHIVSRLKPGGRFLTTHFAAGSFSPMQELIMERLRRYGVEVPAASWTRLESEEANHELYQAAGLANISHSRSQVGYYLDDAHGWWDVVWWAGYRGFVNQVEGEQFARFKQEHIDEINALADEKGILFKVDVIHTIGYKS